MDKLLIWGTGFIARKVIDNGLNGEIVGFIETKKSREAFERKPIYNVDEVRALLDTIDFIVIANACVEDVYRSCMDKGIDLNKIIFLNKVKVPVGFYDQDCIKQILGEKNYAEYCSNYGLYENSFFQEDMEEYKKKNIRKNFRVQEDNLYPIIYDKFASAGSIHNYFWQDLWAARLITKAGIRNHFDIGSRLDGFIAHLLAANVNVTMIDVREFPGKVENLHTIVDDATLLQQIPDNSIESMSALCSLEHFGLGRYGDPIDPEACFKCFEAIQRKLVSGGRLYISVPVGKERVEFNAHRVFYPNTIVECFASMRLEEFSCTAGGEIEYKVDIHKYDNDNHNGDYRYGLFHFVKK